jgi:hypothetical protein
MNDFAKTGSGQTQRQNRDFLKHLTEISRRKRLRPSSKTEAAVSMSDFSRQLFIIWIYTTRFLANTLSGEDRLICFVAFFRS